MYGLSLQKKINEIKKNKKVMVLIGSQKVEKEAYDTADYNISITNQPHSEISALAIFLYELFGHKEPSFKHPQIKITPSNKTKKVTKETKAKE